MSTEAQIGKWPKSGAIALGIAIPTLFFMFRFTAAAAFLIFFLFLALFPLHRSRRSLFLAFALFAVAILVPVDVYVPGFHGPLYGSKHDGLRFVRVVHGMPRIQNDLALYGEFIADGCVVGLYDTQWRLVWD